jgi:acetyltransferase-like isoleucine patch superfamily enzyme
MASVGMHCVVGAGSVVTRPVPDYAVVAGAPARVIRYRYDQKAESTGDRDEPAGCVSRGWEDGPST